MIKHASYYNEPTEIPSFWVSTYEGVSEILDQTVKRGTVETIGQTAGGRPIRAVFYGTPRTGRGGTTFSGALGARDINEYIGPDHAKRVIVFLGGVHGGEFEGIVGLANLISALETGVDLGGVDRGELVSAAERVDRIVVVPIVNVDGRVRIPLRMEPHHGTDNSVHEYFNTGCFKDGSLIGWPTCKKFIPLDFSLTEFPGGYPNDNGVNIQHDDFFGNRQPETEALLRLLGEERPNLIVNLHTGAPAKNYHTRLHRPFTLPMLEPVFESYYRHVHTALTLAGLQDSRDVELEADPARQRQSPFNLDTVFSLHCGGLSVIVEAPSHSFNGFGRAGNVVEQTPEKILEAQLTVYKASLEFVAGM